MELLAVVIGLGEIGRPIRAMLIEAFGIDVVKGQDLDTPSWSNCSFKFMHICFPQTPDFLTQLQEYIWKYNAEFVIIHSTLSPGMTDFLTRKLAKWHDVDQQPHYVKIFYSPVRGNVKDEMGWCLKAYTKYVAGPDKSSLYVVASHLGDAGFKVKTLLNAKAVEYAKLWDLAWYGLNIAFYQELERACNPKIYRVIREFIESTPVESEGKVPRVVFYGGYIGGHCVIPAIEKILADKDIPLLQAVLNSNIKRETELAFGKPPHHPKRN